MAIGSAVEIGGAIHIHDEKGKRIGTVPKQDGLHGYTSTTVSVRAGSVVHIYDERGRRIRTIPAG